MELIIVISLDGAMPFSAQGPLPGGLLYQFNRFKLVIPVNRNFYILGESSMFAPRGRAPG